MAVGANQNRANKFRADEDGRVVVLMGGTDSGGTTTTGTAANVASSASSVTLLAANTSAKARTIFNDSTAALYVKFGTTASATSFKVKLAAGGYYEFPAPLYTGRVDGIWASADGFARVDEDT